VQPAGKIAPQPWMTAPEARRVLAALGAGGRPARFVGGCVRDAMVGRGVKDVDIATPEPPDAVIRLLQAAGIRAVPTGVDHGTVTAVDGEAHFEITTLRHDVETFGRRARVAFTDDWAADAARRDFTFNAMFCDPDGTLYDPTGGLADLQAGRVRFVGAAQERIREDVLRLLRFFRFHAHYGRGVPDAEALAACRALAPELAALSAERVWSELRRTLLAPDPAAALALMRDNAVLDHVLPEATRLDRLAAVVRDEAACARDGDPIRRLAAAIATNAAGATALAQRLRLSNAERDRLVALVAPVMRLTPSLDGHERRVALYRLGAEAFADLALLGWAEQATRGVTVDDSAWRALIADAAAWTPIALPVAGRDAVALGIPRGPEIGWLMAQLEAWWIDGDFRADREACLRQLKSLIRARRNGGDGGRGR
jgi:poly(A) polymerase